MRLIDADKLEDLANEIDIASCVFMEIINSASTVEAAPVEKVKAWAAKLIEFGEPGARVAICTECGYPVADYGVNEDIYCSWCGTKNKSKNFVSAGAGHCTTSLDRKAKTFDKLLLHKYAAKMDL